LTEILRGENDKAKAAALLPYRGIEVLEWAGLCFHQHSRIVRWFSLNPRVAQTCRGLACLRHVLVENGANGPGGADPFEVNPVGVGPIWERSRNPQVKTCG